MDIGKIIAELRAKRAKASLISSSGRAEYRPIDFMDEQVWFPEFADFIAFAANHAIEIADTWEWLKKESDATQRRFEHASENAAMLGCDNSEMKEKIATLEAELARVRRGLDSALTDLEAIEGGEKVNGDPMTTVRLVIRYLSALTGGK